MEIRIGFAPAQFYVFSLITIIRNCVIIKTRIYEIINTV